MTIDIQVANRQRKNVIKIAWTKKAAAKILDGLCQNLRAHPIKRFPKKYVADFEDRGQVSLSFVSEKEIQRLNKMWRGMDKKTDVLSFPLELTPPDKFLPWQLGEVIICPSYALKQAEALGHTLEREIAFLLAHGFLHLLDFDHQTKAQEKDMFSRQKEILEKAGFPR